MDPSAPYLCGTAPVATQAKDGAAVFERLLAAVAANSRKGTPEYGMLAMGTGDEQWARLFRDSLLEEAAAGRFSQAAHSVKFIQYEASQRAYYFPLVRQAFPELFSAADSQKLADWFGAINRRALTVEWVDWMYAAALGRLPEGPYENQENGAGLLSLLISTGLEAPELADANRAYLLQNPRGWLARFRNTDDAFVYQPEWLTNAFFQAGYNQRSADANRALSFEWLLLQALPDGQAPNYNYPARHSIAGIAYLAAVELADPRYIWLADRALQTAETLAQPVFAQPGAERAVSLPSASPDIGSCLMYGDSGLPTQAGPLAPDKIVFRDGWTQDARYLLLNLRFSGWHRYKATNTVTSLSLGGPTQPVQSPILSDLVERATFRWLPRGRSLLRDKRVSRENLSGLVISERGIRAALHGLTAIGSQWAQDPPWHADVMAFQPGDTLDWSHTRITDWQGWKHDRYIYFYHDGGPIVVADRAGGPGGSRAALAWHLRSEEALVTGKTWRLRLAAGGEPVEVLVVPISADEQARGRLTTTSEGDGAFGAVYTPAASGRLEVVTVFLTGEWLDADVRLLGPASQPSMSLSRDGAELQVPLYR